MNAEFKETRITVREIDDHIRPLMYAGLPFSAAYGLALSAVLRAKGVRHRHRTVIAREAPELLPPYQVWRDICTQDWVIRQGAPA